MTSAPAPVDAAAAPSTPLPAARRLGDMGYETLPAGMTGSELLRYRTGYAAGQRKFRTTTELPSPVIVNLTTGGTTGGRYSYGPTPGTAAGIAHRDELAARGRAWRMAEHPAAHAAGIAELRKYLTARGDAGRGAALVDPATGQPIGLGKRSTAARRPRPVSTYSKALTAALHEGEVTYATVAETAASAAPVDVPAPAPAPVDDPSPAAPVVDIRSRVHVIPVTIPPAPDTDTDTAPDAPAAPLEVDNGPDAVAVAVAAAGETIPDPAHGRRATRRALASVLRAAGIVPAGADWSRACQLAGLTDGAE